MWIVTIQNVYNPPTVIEFDNAERAARYLAHAQLYWGDAILTYRP